MFRIETDNLKNSDGASLNLTISLLAVALSLVLTPAMAQTVPTDASPTCTVPAATFKTWFNSGAVTLNGAVNPANSVTFPNTPNCSFYQWSEQMFLWLTSPTISSYGGSGRIFDSPVFYDVSPLNASGKRSFLPHVASLPRGFMPRVAQVGPHGLPVILAKSGKLLEVLMPPTGATGKPLIRDKTGNFLEINSVKVGEDHKPKFFDKSNKLIEHQLPQVPAIKNALKNIARPITIVTKFNINGVIVLLDPFGNVIDTEEGQADNGVLISQNGSLVYYITLVNDVYAYMSTGVTDGGISPAAVGSSAFPNSFPTTAANLNQIVTFAAAHGVTFPDANALTIEVKSSWVEASSLTNPGSYITMEGVVPVYDKSNPAIWTPTGGKKSVLLAMVGMHVVGSVNGHPEMVWATFEHVNNAPNTTYSYNNAAGTTTTVNQNTAGAWLFTANNATGTFNVPIMQDCNAPGICSASAPIGAIAALPGFTNTASNVIRAKAWGSASNQQPNPFDSNAAASNTEIIAINNSVLTQLVNGDIRANYIFTGATWTELGESPTAPFPGGNVVGASQLANTTMETFQQGSSNTNASSSNCFDCHSFNTTNVSHVFPVMNPLF
ncbi:MAG: hypothetical protein ABSB19_10165 [Methylomonas sp.]|jgi:hypothetical protein